MLTTGKAVITLRQARRHKGVWPVGPEWGSMHNLILRPFYRQYQSYMCLCV
jgi:hypothetical protein